jgi:methyl-accepting chemotaxis protein
LEGRLGVVELGVTDRDVRRELTAMTRTVLIALLLCMGVGISLAAVLSYVINRPVQELIEIAMGIRSGHFDARAAVRSSDEVGELAAAFNEMSHSL